ncbi:TIM barrel protein [Glutamicibacter sp.]|uniref:sugar phosphate isomerase/epimerase family protein n=1 Tax=Glutamicibacter sp. TaxID=1931995 RepID=UPI0028BDF738|nr:TIM barrel protein [Glutamicibacter sp.]
MTQITHRGIDSSPDTSAAFKQSTFRIGAQFSRFPTHAEQDLQHSIKAALAAGFTAITINSLPLEMQNSTQQELRDVVAELHSADIELTLGLGSAGPVGDPLALRSEACTALELGLELGCRNYFFYTRSIRDTSHSQQLRQIRHTLKSLSPLAAQAGARINLKTHEDLASGEVSAIVDSLDPAVFSIGLDVANLVVRGEDPLAVTTKLADQIGSTHLEDIVLFPIGTGYRRRLRPIGEGVLDYLRLLEVLWDAGVRTFTVEQHQGRFDTPVHDPSWFASEPHSDPVQLGALAGYAWTTTQLAARGDIADLENWDEEPSAESKLAQLKASATNLSAVLSKLAARTTASEES